MLIVDDVCYLTPKWISYCRRFHIICPENGIWVQVGSPELVWIRVNGQLIQNGFYQTPDEGVWVYIPPEFLRCRHNQICFCTYGGCPNLWYRLWYPPQQCHLECRNHPMKYFNKRTCKCESRGGKGPDWSDFGRNGGGRNPETIRPFIHP